MTTKPSNRQDATLTNINALKKQVKALECRVRIVERRMKDYKKSNRLTTDLLSDYATRIAHLERILAVQP